MKQIEVSCAIIERNGLVFSAQRSADMSMPLKWEFPGGKIRENESPEDCLAREIAEELNVKIAITGKLRQSRHAYPEFAITLHPFTCTIMSGEPSLIEHSNMIWLPPGRLAELDWAQADLPVLDQYLRQLKTLNPEN